MSSSDQNTPDQNHPGHLEISWPVDDTWNAHRRRDIMESLDRMLKIRSVGLLEGTIRRYQRSDTTAAAEAPPGEPIAWTERRRQQEQAIQTAVGQALETHAVDRFVRMDFSEDKNQVTVRLTFPVPPAALKTYLTGARALNEDPQNDPLLARVLSKMIDGIFALLTGADQEVMSEVHQEVRHEMDRTRQVALQRRWGNALGRELTVDLALWAHAEGLPTQGRMYWFDPDSQVRVQDRAPNIGKVYEMVEESWTNTEHETVRGMIRRKVDLIQRVIRSFGREPQPMVGDDERAQAQIVQAPRAPRM